MDEEWWEKNRKLGGFLLFFTVLSFLGIFSLFYQVSTASTSSGNAIYEQYIKKITMLSIASIALMFVRLIAIFIRKKKMVLFSIVGAPVLSVISYFITSSTMHSLNQGGGYYLYSMPSGYGFQVFISCIFGVVWVLYIVNSERCEVYFEEEEVYNGQIEFIRKRKMEAEQESSTPPYPQYPLNFSGQSSSNVPEQSTNPSTTSAYTPAPTPQIPIPAATPAIGENPTDNSKTPDELVESDMHPLPQSNSTSVAEPFEESGPSTHDKASTP